MRGVGYSSAGARALDDDDGEGDGGDDGVEAAAEAARVSRQQSRLLDTPALAPPDGELRSKGGVAKQKMPSAGGVDAGPASWLAVGGRAGGARSLLSAVVPAGGNGTNVSNAIGLNHTNFTESWVSFVSGERVENGGGAEGGQKREEGDRTGDWGGRRKVRRRTAEEGQQQQQQQQWMVGTEMKWCLTDIISPCWCSHSCVYACVSRSHIRQATFATTTVMTVTHTTPPPAVVAAPHTIPPPTPPAALTQHVTLEADVVLSTGECCWARRCSCTCTHARTRAHTHAQLEMRLHAHIGTHTYAHTYAHTYTHS